MVHERVRTCIGCRRRGAQETLVRLVRGPDGQLAIGRTLPGRGAWLCRGTDTEVAVDCLLAAQRRQAFARAFRAPVTAEAVEALRASTTKEAAPGGPFR